MKLAALLAAALAAALPPFCAFARVLNATAETIQVQLAAAGDGDTVRPTGSLPPKIAILNLNHMVPVTLDLTHATVAWLAISHSSGWTIVGDGHGNGVVGQDAPYDAIQVIASDHLRFTGLTITGYGARGGAGIGLLDSNHVSIESNVFRDAPGDGVDVVSSQDIEIINNTCERLPYGVVLHTDCVQIWNKPKDPLTVVNVLIDHNRASGHMQGFDTFGAGDPRPLVGIVITNNFAAIDTKWAGAINLPNYPCLKCKMVGNRSETLPSYPANWEPIGWYNGGVLAPGNTRR